MKLMFRTLSLAFAVLIVSCSKEDSNSTNSSTNASMTQSDMSADAKLNDMSDDVSDIADSQFATQTNSSFGKSPDNDDFMPSCASVTVTETQNSWTRTIDFGADGCTMANGNVLKGKIIMTGSKDYTTKTQTISVTFDNFYHNDALVQGSKTITREIKSTDNLSAEHPVCTMTENFAVTKLTDVVLTVTGTRVRELVDGYSTPHIMKDNVYLISGNRNTTSPKGTFSSTITTSLDLPISCHHIVKGVINFVKNDKTATLDYGNGDCDNLATITINGQTSQIKIGKQ